jgi:hypothetical protein
MRRLLVFVVLIGCANDRMSEVAGDAAVFDSASALDTSATGAETDAALDTGETPTDVADAGSALIAAATACSSPRPTAEACGWSTLAV